MTATETESGNLDRLFERARAVLYHEIADKTAEPDSAGLYPAIPDADLRTRVGRIIFVEAAEVFNVLPARLVTMLSGGDLKLRHLFAECLARHIATINERTS